MNTLQGFFAEYHPSEEANDAVYKEFTDRVADVSYLKAHRDWVEQNEWGFGDRAFHYMWYLLLTEDILTRTDPSILEIGVYKGQVISLWSLIAIREERPASIYAITPLSGKRQFPRYIHQLAMVLSKQYRKDALSGNLYSKTDYFQCIERIYTEFDLEISLITLLHGYSGDEHVKKAVSDIMFDLVYIDGGHRYEEASHDIKYFGRKVKVGGYLVIDDASFFLPGTVFWKGHETVSRAAEEIEADRFANVLNVGHNRVYVRIKE